MSLVGATVFDNGVVGGLSGKIISVALDGSSVDVVWSNRIGVTTITPTAGRYSVRLVEEVSK